MIAYVRTAPMPNCKHCNFRMAYWIPGLSDNEHAHPECEAEASVDAIVREIKAALALNGDRKP